MDRDGHVWGHVTGLKPEEWAVLCFIKAENNWWTKPSYDAPLSPVNQSGEWDIDITTGEIDECATEVLVFMVPASSVPTICDPCYDIMGPPEAVDSDIANRAPPARYITFASRQWTVRRSDCSIPNRFSDSEDKVWVDEDGKLHLTITFENGAWYSTIIEKKHGIPAHSGQAEIPQRHQCTPNRNSLPFDRWVALELQYIDQWSLWLDLKILLKTIFVFFRFDGQ